MVFISCEMPVVGNSWGVDSTTGSGCVGCGPQEQFYGCADVAVGQGPGPPRPKMQQPVHTGSAVRTNWNIHAQARPAWPKQSWKQPTWQAHPKLQHTHLNVLHQYPKWQQTYPKWQQYPVQQYPPWQYPPWQQYPRKNGNFWWQTLRPNATDQSLNHQAQMGASLTTVIFLVLINVL